MVLQYTMTIHTEGQYTTVILVPSLYYCDDINGTLSLSLKILAWSPVTFVAEFLQLLPAFISKTSASEVCTL